MLQTLNSAKYTAITCSVGTYTRSSLDTLLKIHSLRDISRRVNQEVQWLTVEPRPPNEQCAPPGFLDGFKKLLLAYNDSKVVLGKATLSSDLATLTCNNWVNIATIQAFIDLLNASSYNVETAAFILNDLIPLNETELQRWTSTIRRGKQIRSIVFIIYVAGNIRETCVATPENPGCHWTLLYVDTVQNKWFYCDTLGWAVPTNLKSSVDSILDGFSGVFPIFRKPAHGRFIAHKPEGNGSGFHRCTESCFKNIPLQFCGNICGIIVVAMGAISCLSPTLWRSGFLDTNSSLPNEISWIANPAKHSSYLRRVLIHWLTAKDIDLQLLGIKPSFSGDHFASTIEEEDQPQEPEPQPPLVADPELLEMADPEPLQGSGPEPIKKTAPEPLQETASEPYQNTASEPPQGTAFETLQEASPELPEDTVPQPPQDTTLQPPQETGPTLPTELGLEQPQETAQTTPQDSAPEPPQETGQETAQHSFPEPPQETAQETPLDSAPEPPQETAQETPQDSAPELPQETAQETPQDTASEPPQDTAPEPAEDTASGPSQDTAPGPPYDIDPELAQETDQGKDQKPVQQKNRDKKLKEVKIDEVTKVHKCPECDYTCPKVSNMKRHMMRKHAMDGQNLTFQSRKCLCIECGRQFYRIKDLREHLSTEHGFNFKTEALLMHSVKGILRLFTM